MHPALKLAVAGLTMAAVGLIQYIWELDDAVQAHLAEKRKEPKPVETRSSSEAVADRKSAD